MEPNENKYSLFLFVLTLKLETRLRMAAGRFTDAFDWRHVENVRERAAVGINTEQRDAGTKGH